MKEWWMDESNLAETEKPDCYEDFEACHICILINRIFKTILSTEQCVGGKLMLYWLDEIVRRYGTKVGITASAKLMLMIADGMPTEEKGRASVHGFDISLN